MFRFTSKDNGPVRPSGQSAGVVDYSSPERDKEEAKKINEYIDKLQTKIGLTTEQREHAFQVMMSLYYDGRRNGFSR